VPKPDPQKQASADEHYEDIGRSIAALVVEAGFSASKAWSLLASIDGYRMWMVDCWVDRYREEAGPPRKRLGRPKKKKPDRWQILKNLEFANTQGSVPYNVETEDESHA
jgi:hypothetical protein